MMQFLKTCLNRFPRLKLLLKSLHNRLFSEAVSSHYVALKANETDSEGERLRSAWHDKAMPQKQRALVDRQLQQYRAGIRIDNFEVFVRCLQELPNIETGMSLLEIGCSSGYYSEVLEISGLSLKYSGCDYAPAFIELARKKYPTLDFSVEDATSLRYPDASFDVVVSGCCLLHIPEYAKSVVETARIAKSYVIFHRTPVVWGQPEQWYRKQAYGVETVEIHFNEAELLDLLASTGLILIATHTLHQDNDATTGYAVRTYVCRKNNQ
jgi:SAM-dependent methyltransferase